MSALERQRRYRAKHKEKAKATYRKSAKKWREVHIEKSRENCKRYYEKNKVKINTSKKLLYASSPEYRKKINEQRIKSVYDLSPEQYQILVEVQNGVCAVCKIPQKNRKSSQLFVDHEHKTGRIRGLLCHKCNVAIGFIKEDITVALNIINYLKQYDQHN